MQFFLHVWSQKKGSVHLFPVSTPPPAIIHISLNVCLQIRKLGRQCEVWYFKQRLRWTASEQGQSMKVIVRLTGMKNIKQNAGARYTLHLFLLLNTSLRFGITHWGTATYWCCPVKKTNKGSVSEGLVKDGITISYSGRGSLTGCDLRNQIQKEQSKKTFFW